MDGNALQEVYAQIFTCFASRCQMPRQLDGPCLATGTVSTVLLFQQSQGNLGLREACSGIQDGPWETYCIDVHFLLKASHRFRWFIGCAPNILKKSNMSSWMLIFKKMMFHLLNSRHIPTDSRKPTWTSQMNCVGSGLTAASLYTLRRPMTRSHRHESDDFNSGIAGKKKRTVIAGAWWKRCQVVYSLMRVIAVVECCEGLLWIKERPRFQSGVQGQVLPEAEFFPVFFNLRWMIFDIINKGLLHFDSQGYIRPAASLRPAIPASCRPASWWKWLWFELGIGFSLQIGLLWVFLP